MIYLIKIIFFLLISHYSLANENKTNQILFKINNKVYTNIDFEERKKYVSFVNNFIQSEFSELEKKEILEDYISALIFYEYYNEKKIFYKKLNNEVELIFKKNFKDSEILNHNRIKNLKFNINIDLVRNKIIEENLNLQKNSLLQKTNKLDLLYNYNLQYLIVKENLINTDLIKSVDDENKFNKLKEFLIENKIDFFHKEKDINDNTIVSNKIKNIINQNIQIYNSNENGYINLILIKKNFESYEGIYVKLINFKSTKPIKKKNLQCDKLDKTIDINKIVFKEYEYSKLNNNIKNNLKSIDDFIMLNDNNEYNYIILCDLTYDENLLKNINFNKNVNSLVKKIQVNFLKKYKNEYKFIKIK